MNAPDSQRVVTVVHCYIMAVKSKQNYELEIERRQKCGDILKE